MSLVVEVRCDVCDVCGDSSAVKRAHVMRGELREKQGWHNGGKFDLCPKCWKREKEGRRDARADK